MKFNDRLFEDLTRVAGGAASLLTGVRDSADRRRGEANNVPPISREEFDAVRDMAAKAREIQEGLERRIAVLEAAASGSPWRDEQP